MKTKKIMEKRGISYIEIFIAFGVFLIGVSLVTYFFIPFFRPEYRTALNILEKNFEKNFTIKASLINVVVNQTGCIKFPSSISYSNSLFLNKNFENVGFEISNGNAIIDINEENFYLLSSSKEINTAPPQFCFSPKEARVYYSPPVEEMFLDLNAINNAIANNYEDLKKEMLSGIKLDFNITIVDHNSLGLPIARLNVFTREKIYKVINNNKIELIKVRFYVW